MLAIRLPSPPFYLCIRSSSSSISSPSAPEGGVRIGNAKRLPPSPSSAKKLGSPAGSPEDAERSQSSKRERCRTSVRDGLQGDEVRGSLDQRSSRIGHGPRSSCERGTRAHALLAHSTISTRFRVKRVVDKVRGRTRRGRIKPGGGAAALDPRSMEDVGGRLFGGRPRRRPAAPR